MDRRKFLITGASFITGSLVGINSFSRVFASTIHQPVNFDPPRIALIIDDIGHSFGRARRFLDLNAPITFSILPLLAKSRYIAEEIHSHGRELMLHQPMEPFDSHINPGPGAIYVGDEPDRIIKIIYENLSCISFTKGVNNHMGSRLTACRRETYETLTAIKKKGLFFVDSRTSSLSTAYQTAKKLHMPTTYRDVFLDNHIHEAYILSQLNSLKRKAVKNGHAIGIGHPYPETARAIKEFLKNIKPHSIQLVPVSSLIRA